ncbi:ABC transporter permease [Lewinella sp. 4G2]|uniref:ABC transporter permease n=1 Tax=Lewinella sp. 4G2 TaxID=1803372 RepID=UPI0007E087C8|nr:FtsX-like permease family protein [Lewinella sp. 4G2]OAV42670.1 hypothetical protein A3850_015620 [Lewinella sp. 4G2]
MIGHLLKLMWNKRRANSMIFLEILLAFIVLFGVYGFLGYCFERYSSPLGFSYENSIGVRVDLPDDLDSLGAIQLQERIRRDLLDLPQVEGVTWLGPVNPFGSSTWMNGSEVNGQNIMAQMMFTDEHFAETAEVELIEGRWFEPGDYSSKYPPMVVNKEFQERYYPGTSVIDSVFDIGGEYQVVGVTGDFKFKGNFAENFPLVWYPQLHRMQEEDNSPFEMMILRLQPGSLADVEETIYKQLVAAVKSTEVVIWDMAKDRKKANRDIVVPIVILSIISAFLLINIALGLFGVLFTQINRRRAEIGLRKAMGATPSQITTQFVMEILLVTSAALLLGAFFAVQVPLLELTPIPGKYFYFGILGAIATILLIVVLCAFVPSRQAASLQPASVLHEE